jgi:hypothetical protein
VAVRTVATIVNGTETRSALIEPFDPDDEVDCPPTELQYLPVADAFILHQHSQGNAHVDCITLTREMAEQIAELIRTDFLSAKEPPPHGLH